MALSMLQGGCSYPHNLDLVYEMQPWTIVQQCQMFCNANFYILWLKYSKSYQAVEFGNTLTEPTEFWIWECNDYFREKPTIADMKLFDIQGKGDWSLYMISCF